LLVGQVAQGADGRMRLLLAADYGRLEFLRVLRSHPAEAVTDVDAIIRGTRAPFGPALPDAVIPDDEDGVPE
ncbi:MAG: rod shape-determining protein MreC, partial [Paracoccus sp. (in: a-proteobacteria)]|nr:rod shape-determining protein MreC [Paracoccus sp. (in: a-proteobacteria)]